MSSIKINFPYVHLQYLCTSDLHYLSPCHFFNSIPCAGLAWRNLLPTLDLGQDSEDTDHLFYSKHLVQALLHLARSKNYIKKFNTSPICL